MTRPPVIRIRDVLLILLGALAGVWGTWLMLVIMLSI
jgi:hypothetical protein